MRVTEFFKVSYSKRLIASKRLPRHAAKDILGIRAGDERFPLEAATLKF